jgi:hypothetical protein
MSISARHLERLSGSERRDSPDRRSASVESNPGKRQKPWSALHSQAGTLTRPVRKHKDTDISQNFHFGIPFVADSLPKSFLSGNYSPDNDKNSLGGASAQKCSLWRELKCAIRAMLEPRPRVARTLEQELSEPCSLDQRNHSFQDYADRSIR